MRYTLSFRIWHWLNAFVILVLIGTVFLRKTFLSWRTNSDILMSKLLEFDIVITADQAKILAKAIRAEMWEWHIIFGYALVFLVVYRVILFFKDNSIKDNFFALSLHKKGVRLLYYVFYITLIFMSISGLIIYFHDLLGISHEIAHSIKEVHEFIFYFIVGFIVIHIIGLIIAENRDEKGIISRMIHG